MSADLFKKPFFWLSLVLALIWLAIIKLPDQKLHLVFCDVGQGDAVLIYQGQNQVLLDGGPDSSVLTCLANHLPFYDRQIELMVATHPDADHLTGLIDVLERYNVSQLVINSTGKDSAVFRKFKEAVAEEGLKVYFPKKGEKIKLGSLSLAVLWPQSQGDVLGITTLEGAVNELSLVFKLSFGDFDALLPGDITSQIEDRLDLEEVKLLKVAHHGSKYSTSPEFLEKTSPQLAIISVGKNSFGHPTKEVLERLESLGVKILRTDLKGEIEVVTDGQKWGLKGD